MSSSLQSNLQSNHFHTKSLGNRSKLKLKNQNSEERMSFQDLQYGGKPPSLSGRASSQKSSQSVAAGIFQINTAVSGFRRLVDAIGTSKDTLDHRQKLSDLLTLFQPLIACIVTC